MLLITSLFSTEVFSDSPNTFELGKTSEKYEILLPVKSDKILRANEVMETSERVLKLASAAIEDQYDSELYRFDLKVRWIPRSILNLSTDQIQTVEPIEKIGRYTSFEVKYRANGRLESTNIQLVVELEKRLPVANQRIHSGEVIKMEMLGEAWVPLATNRGQLVDSTDDLIGFKVRRTLAPGQPVRHSEVSKGFVVESGETARLIFDEFGVQIEIEVIAQSSGEQDEEIIFFSEETRNRYLGRISGPGMAIWRKTL